MDAITSLCSYTLKQQCTVHAQLYNVRLWEDGAENARKDDSEKHEHQHDANQRALRSLDRLGQLASVVGVDIADAVLLQFFLSGVGVSDGLEAIRRICAADAEKNANAAGMLIGKLSHIVDVAVDDEPEVVILVVLLNIVQTEQLGGHCWRWCANVLLLSLEEVTEAMQIAVRLKYKKKSESNELRKLKKKETLAGSSEKKALFCLFELVTWRVFDRKEATA